LKEYIHVTPRSNHVWASGFWVEAEKWRWPMSKYGSEDGIVEGSENDMVGDCKRKGREWAVGRWAWLYYVYIGHDAGPSNELPFVHRRLSVGDHTAVI
jgi:hypothetical protein